MLLLKKSIILTTALFILIASSGIAIADNIKLPEVDGWINGEVRTTEFNALSGYKGNWQERSYRAMNGTRFNAILINGSAAKLWSMAKVSEDKGEVWGGEIAEETNILGRRALFEERSVLGTTLVVKIDKGSVLTLESQNATEKDLAEAAEKIIQIIETGN